MYIKISIKYFKLFFLKKNENIIFHTLSDNSFIYNLIKDYLINEYFKKKLMGNH